jgi:hypothetical protein
MDAPTFCQVFLSKRNLVEPDSRPLYAYRCQKNEFQEIIPIVEKTLSLISCRSRINPRSAALFCLFAAEWWRRSYEGGPWSWDPIFEELSINSDEISPVKRSVIVHTGFRFWKRPLIIKSRTEYIISLACEGGLPLNIVQRQNTHLQRFFRRLLHKYTDYQQAGISAVKLAEDASNLLPTSLRNERVYHLCGKLVESIIDLKCLIPAKTAPSKFIEVLDRKDSEWRDNLPLSLDEDIAASFFNNLVVEAEKNQTLRCQQITFHRYLINNGKKWRLAAEIKIPNSFPLFYLNELFSCNLKETSRYFLEIKSSRMRDRKIAKLVKQIRGNQTQYRVDLIPKTNLLFENEAISSIHFVINNQDGFSATSPIPGGESIEDLPWIFIDDEEGRLVLIRTGSYRSQKPYLFIAVPAIARLKVDDDGVIEEYGNLESSSRILYKVSGSITYEETDDLKYTIRTGADTTDLDNYVIQGRTSRIKGNIDQIFEGFPEYAVSKESGQTALISQNEIYWRASARGRSWSSNRSGMYGITEMAHIRNGEIYKKTRLGIIPENFKLEILPLDVNSGIIRFTNHQNALVSTTTNNSSIDIDIQQSDSEQISILCSATEDIPSRFLVKLMWEKGSEIQLVIPFPVHGSCFTDGDGNRIPRNQKIVVDSLYGIEAVTVAQNEADFFTLNGYCIAPHLSRMLQCAININEPFQGEYRLINLKPLFLQIFSSSESLDTEVHLKVEGRGRDSDIIRVSRFDISLGREADNICLRHESKRYVSQEELQAIKLFAMPIADPYIEPGYLAQEEENGIALGQWKLNSANRQDGFWMVFGHINGVYRIRPRSIPVQNIPIEESNNVEQENPENLLEAVAVKDMALRQIAYKERFREMIQAPDHSDWDIVDQYISRYENLPLSSLDLFTAMSHNHEIMAMLLLKKALSDFDKIWSFREELPFSWLTVSLDTWIKVSDLFYESLANQLESIPEKARIDIIKTHYNGFFSNITAGNKPFAYLVEALTRKYFEKRKIQGNQDEQIKQLRLLYQMRYAELIRKHSEDDWPQGPNFRNLIASEVPELLDTFDQVDTTAAFRITVQEAPIYAATVCIAGLKVSNENTFAIKFFRDFDREWFDDVYHYSLVQAHNKLSKRGSIKEND